MSTHRSRPLSALFAAGALSLLGLLASCKGGSDPSHFNDIHNYASQKGKLHFEFSNDIRGSEDIFWEDWGRKEVRVSRYEELFRDKIHPVYRTTIRDKSTITMIEEPMKTAFQFVDPTLDSLYHLSTPPTPAEAGAALLNKLNVKPAGKTKFLGLDCEVWKNDAMGQTYITWNGLPLRNEISTPMGGFLKEATIFDTTIGIDPKLMVVPADVEIKHTQGPPRNLHPN